MRSCDAKQIKRELKNVRRTLAQDEKQFAAMRELITVNQGMLDRLKAGHIEGLAPGISPSLAMAHLEVAIAGQEQVLARGELGLEPLRQMIRSLESPGMTWEKANSIAEEAARDFHRNFNTPLDKTSTIQ